MAMVVYKIPHGASIYNVLMFISFSIYRYMFMGSLLTQYPIKYTLHVKTHVGIIGIIVSSYSNKTFH